VKRDWQAEYEKWKAKAEYIFKELSDLPNVDVHIVHPERAARLKIVPRVELILKKENASITLLDLLSKLRSGDPPIEVEYFYAITERKIYINPQCLQRRRADCR
jgi:SOS-response transcriptional repressor LexA